jgi:hypothetical protein
MRKKLIAPLGLLAAAVVVVPVAVSAATHGSVSQGAAAKPATAKASVRPAAAAGPGHDCLGFAARSPQTRVVTDDFARINTSTNWTTLPCGSTTISVPRGHRALVVAHVDAEVSCRGPNLQWCQGRVLIGRVEGEPNAPEPDSFAWATARADLNQWEANAFTRTAVVACPRTSPRPICLIPVITQVRNHALGMTMRVDDRTLHVQVNF